MTAPASYDNCLAVAATGPGDTLWVDSSRGTAVDVSMPGSCVYVAAYDDKTPVVRMASGTSYAVAHLAAAAALWLAHHGRQSLINKYGTRRIQAAFSQPCAGRGWWYRPGWDPDYGVGRVDLLALLQAPLPEPQDLVEVGAFGASNDDAVARIAAMISADPVRVRTRLAELLKVSTPEELNQTIAEHEGELLYLVLADRTFAESLAQPGPSVRSLHDQRRRCDRRAGRKACRVKGPLSDLLVIDLSRAVAGPHAAMMLGDLGARVIKIERPGEGDETPAGAHLSSTAPTASRSLPTS